MGYVLGWARVHRAAKGLVGGLVFGLLGLQGAIAGAGDLLDGDEKLACEAILCLAATSGTPSACAPSLSRYFGISAKKWSDTISMRRNFLNLCPTVSAPKMGSLVNAISSSAGQCSKNSLNSRLIESVCPSTCTDEFGASYKCSIPCTVIDPTLPSSCSAFFNHEYVEKTGVPTYVGTPEGGGSWQ